jgi:flagellum-specific ATP synthase
MYATLKENEVLIRIGAYQKGSDPEIDEAIDKKSKIEDFLKQDRDEIISFDVVVERLRALTGS